MQTNLFTDQEIKLERPVIRYHGSKWTLAPWIISHFPEHKTYVEAFGGGAAVLLRKPRSKIEVYNDLDTEMVRFFQFIRDPGNAHALAAAIELSPFSRTEFEQAYQTDAVTALEQNRRLLVRSYMGFGSHSHNTENSNGFRRGTHKPYATEWAGLPKHLVAVVEKLRGVIFERLNAYDLIPGYDGTDTLFFLDPPYPRNLRTDHGKGYRHEMSEAEHKLLAMIIRKVEGKVMLCGYPSDLYDRVLYHDWHRVERKFYAQGQGGAAERTEVLWMNYQPPKI